MPNHRGPDKPRGLRSGSPSSAADLLARSPLAKGPLSNLNQGVSVSASLRDRLCAWLPPAAAGEVREVLEKPGQVVVFTESAAWAARLKVALSELPPQVLGLDVLPKIVVRVMPTGRFRR
jgi:hypothetical protein